jgi:sialidase-1
MKKLFFFGFALTFSFITASSQERVKVFVSGTEGNKVYRIPAIIKLPDGGLLAFCEGRVNDAGDFGDINIVSKRSNDGGKTWSALQTVVDYDVLQAGNPAPVVDLNDPLYPNGRIFLFYNTGNNHEGEVRKGKGLREVWYKTSTDNGTTWSEPVNITQHVHRPRQPSVNPAYNFLEDWRSYAIGPGHAMQFTSGKYKGRIFVPANHSAGEPQEQFKDYAAHGFYTDDHGKTFHLGESVNIPGSNESTATEISGDKLLMNIRNQRGDIRARIIAISKSGGVSWDTAYFNNDLPDPVSQGSILTIDKRNGKNIIAFSNAADLKRRDNLTLRISFDDGKTWKGKYVIDKSGDQNARDYTAYSDIVILKKQTVGILYERNNYSEIVFAIQHWSK